MKLRSKFYCYDQKIILAEIPVRLLGGVSIQALYTNVFSVAITHYALFAWIFWVFRFCFLYAQLALYHFFAIKASKVNVRILNIWIPNWAQFGFWTDLWSFKPNWINNGAQFWLNSDIHCIQKWPQNLKILKPYKKA